MRVRGLLCLYSTAQTGQPRIGFAIARKHLPSAVHRNRIKRLLRENFRHQSADMPAYDLIVLSQRELTEITRDDWPEMCRKLFVRIIARFQPQT